MTLRQEAEVDGRTPLVAGNWKMFKTRSAAEEFADALAGRLDELNRLFVRLKLDDGRFGRR